MRRCGGRMRRICPRSLGNALSDKSEKNFRALGFLGRKKLYFIGNAIQCTIDRLVHLGLFVRSNLPAIKCQPPRASITSFR